MECIYKGIRLHTSQVKDYTQRAAIRKFLHAHNMFLLVSHPHYRREHCPQCTQDTPKRRSKETEAGFFFFFFFSKKNKLKKIKQEKKCKKEKEKYIQQGMIEITLKEHSGRADLPIPHYSPASQSA